MVKDFVDIAERKLSVVAEAKAEAKVGVVVSAAVSTLG